MIVKVQPKLRSLSQTAGSVGCWTRRILRSFLLQEPIREKCFHLTHRDLTACSRNKEVRRRLHEAFGASRVVLFTPKQEQVRCSSGKFQPSKIACSKVNICLFDAISTGPATTPENVKKMLQALDLSLLGHAFPSERGTLQPGGRPAVLLVVDPPDVRQSEFTRGRVVELWSLDGILLPF